MKEKRLYPEDLAAEIRKDGDKLYRPSNGTEGMEFIALWCEHCIRDKAFREDPEHEQGCPIAFNSLLYDIDDPEYPTEWTYDEDGQPMCTAFEQDRPPTRGEILRGDEDADGQKQLSF